MEVAFITHYSSLYGANRSLLDLIDGLRRFGVNAHVISTEDGQIRESLSDRNVPFVVIPFHRWVGWRPNHTKLPGRVKAHIRWRKETITRLLGNLYVSRNIASQLRDWDIDVVYTNSSVTQVGLMAARILSLPHVWHLREFCDLHFNLKFDWGKNYFEDYIGRSDAIISISKAVEDYYLKRVAAERKRVVYNGVASCEFIESMHPEGNLKPSGEPYQFLMLGAIQENKGHGEALQAFAELKRAGLKVRLVIAGEGDTPRVESVARESGVLDMIEFRGYVDDPFTVLRESDALLVCSRHEAMGRVTVEAMSAGIPVIGYDQAGTSELIQHEYNGLLYKGGPKELAMAMRRFIEDPAWASELGKNGWCVAREKYSIERYAEQIYEVLINLLPQDHHCLP